MPNRYSLYEAKARFSAIVRQVREGQRVVVTVHGEPVAEIRPYTAPRSGLEGRLADLADRGILVPGPKPVIAHKAVKRPGGLKRFLRDRHQ